MDKTAIADVDADVSLLAASLEKNQVTQF